MHSNILQRSLVLASLMVPFATSTGCASKDVSFGKASSNITGENAGSGGSSGGGSCVDVDFCGGQSPDGCFCDDTCEQFGDCCADKLDVCGGGPGGAGGAGGGTAGTGGAGGGTAGAGGGSIGGSCAGDDTRGPFCGGQSPDGCFCDDTCEQFGDCCADKLDVCGGSAGAAGGGTAGTGGAGGGTAGTGGAGGGTSGTGGAGGGTAGTGGAGGGGGFGVWLNGLLRRAAAK